MYKIISKAVFFSFVLGLLQVIPTIAQAPTGSVTIKPYLNSSLCVRTEAYLWEGAIMRISDCNKTYTYYDGSKVHYLFQSENNAGLRKLKTTWAPAPDAFGLWGCIFPIDNVVRASNCDNDNPTQDSWEITETQSNSMIFLMKNKSTEQCIRVKEVIDGVTLETTSKCDVTDNNQLWNIILNLNSSF